MTSGSRLSKSPISDSRESQQIQLGKLDRFVNTKLSLVVQSLLVMSQVFLSYFFNIKSTFLTKV